jgi:glycosyltransferase involved in cell wall biosynthesis
MIKVVHIQKHLPTSGNAAFRLHSALLKAGVDSSMLSLSADLCGDSRIRHLNPLYQIVAFLDGKVLNYLTRKAERKFGLFSFPVLGIDIAGKEQIKKADIIYLHWINGGFLNLHSIKKIAKLNKPVIFFMHDMWTITGGCHHSFQCEKYKSQCNACQIFSEHKRNDLSKIEFIRKVKLLSSFDNLYFVAPSTWLYNCAEHSKLTTNKPLFYIPNIIDNELFKPFDKAIAKQILNIDPDIKVISFGAISLNSPYKGFVYLKNAIEIIERKLENKKILVLIFGSSYDKQVSDGIPFKVKFMGRLNDDFSTVLAYNASDVFISPSLADNLPTTVMESMCCGTPVVGFNVGGIPDMIQHKENGYLAKYMDAVDLANGIIFCLTHNIKGKLLPVFEPSNIVRMHMELFAHLVPEFGR